MGEDVRDDYFTLEQGVRACAGANTLQGIDIAIYQGTVNFAQVKSAGGKSLVISKATEGISYNDPTFAAHWAGTKAAGMARGAYHYFRPASDPIAQADHFLAVMGPLGEGDLPPMLDLEETDGQAPSVVASRAKQWLDRVEQRTGRVPWIYSGYYFFRDSMGNPPGWSKYPFVVAAYTTACPLIPDQFPAFKMWQYSGSGSSPGISGAVDLDTYNGSAADLAKDANAGDFRDMAIFPTLKIGGYAMDSHGQLKPVGFASPLNSGINEAGDVMRSIVLRDDAKSGYLLKMDGSLKPFGGAPAITGTPSWPNADVARSVVLRDDDKSGYILDNLGGLHPFGGAVVPSPAGMYWPTQPIAIDMVLRRDGKSGYVLTVLGGLFPFGGAPAISRNTFPASGGKFAFSVTLGFDDESGYIMDVGGGVWAFGGAPTVKSPSFPDNDARAVGLLFDGVTSFVMTRSGNVEGTSGAETGRDVVLNTDGKSGYVLTSFGNLRPFGGAPALSSGATWDWDIARRVSLRADGKSGWMLDGWGGMHPFGGAPALKDAAYFSGQDVVNALAISEDGTKGYKLKSSGELLPLGTAPAATAGLWAGQSVARDIALRSDGVSGYQLDRAGALHPFGGAPALSSGKSWPTLDVARRVVLVTDSSGYLLAADGQVFPFGGARAVLGVTPWTGFDVARGLQVGADAVFVADVYGRTHKYALEAVQPNPNPNPMPTPEPTPEPTPTPEPEPTPQPTPVTPLNPTPAVGGCGCGAAANAPSVAMFGALLVLASRRRVTRARALTSRE